MRLKLWASINKADGRLAVRSCEVSKPREIMCYNSRIALKFGRHFRQRCCRDACQISERLEKSRYESHSFETLRDLAVRRSSVQWVEALMQGQNQSVMTWQWTIPSGLFMRAAISYYMFTIITMEYNWWQSYFPGPILLIWINLNCLGMDQ